MESLVCASETYGIVNVTVVDYVCAKHWLDKAKTCVLTGGVAGLGAVSAEVASNLKTAVVLATKASEELKKMISSLHGLLCSEGSIHVVLVRADSAGVTDASLGETEASEFRRAILLAGFTKVSDVPERAAVPFHSSRGITSVFTFSATKPQWVQGARQGLRMKLRKKKARQENGAGADPAAREEVLRAWKLGGDDGGDLIDDDVLVDEIQVRSRDRHRPLPRESAKIETRT